MEATFEYGYWALFLAAFLAATILPFSSDVMVGGMALAGFDPTLILLSAGTGNILGGITTYGLGRLGNPDWLKKLFRVTEEKLRRYEERIRKYGSWMALLSWVPFAGDIIVLALGFFRVPFWPVFWLMSIGKMGRYAVIIWLLH